MDKRDLIKKHIGGWHGLSKASIDSFAESGKVSGSFLLALENMLEEYAQQEKESQPSKELALRYELIQKFKEAKEGFPAIGFDEEFVRGFNKAFQMAQFITEKLIQQPIKEANTPNKPEEETILTEKQIFGAGHAHGWTNAKLNGKLTWLQCYTDWVEKEGRGVINDKPEEKKEEYKYEMFIDDEGSPFEMNTWIPIANDRIKDISKIDEYISKGLLRVIQPQEEEQQCDCNETTFNNPECTCDYMTFGEHSRICHLYKRD